MEHGKNEIGDVTCRGESHEHYETLVHYKLQRI